MCSACRVTKVAEPAFVAVRRLASKLAVGRAGRAVGGAAAAAVVGAALACRLADRAIMESLRVEEEGALLSSRCVRAWRCLYGLIAWRCLYSSSCTAVLATIATTSTRAFAFCVCFLFVFCFFHFTPSYQGKEEGLCRRGKSCQGCSRGGVSGY